MDQEQTEVTSNEEKEEVTPEQQIVEQPPPSDEQAESSEVNDSTSGKEKGDEQQQNSEDGEQAVSQVSAKEEEEEESTAKPTDKSSRRLRCVDPEGTVDIPIGSTGITVNKPVTIPQFFTKTFEAWPEVKALCWKDKKEEPFKSITYAEYKQLVYNVAKSFLKVMY